MPDEPPTRPAPNRSPAFVVYARISPELGESFEKALALSGRTMRAELEFALRAWFRSLGLMPSE